MRTLLPFCFCLLIATAAAARDIFVNNVTGDDRFDGRVADSTQGSGPVRTLARALRLARKRDRILLANTGQAYHESVGLCGGRHSGDLFAPFVIQGNGAILDGSHPVPKNAWKHHKSTVFRFQPPRMAYQQLFLNGRPLPRVQPQPGDPPSPTFNLRPLEWCLVDGSIYLRIDDDKWIDDYQLSFADQRVGLTLYQVRHVIVADLIVQGFQLDGINANDARECRLDGVTSRGNGRAGVAVAGASHLQLSDCLVGDNGAAQLWVEEFTLTRLRNTELLANTAPDVARRGGRVEVEAPAEPPAEPAP